MSNKLRPIAQSFVLCRDIIQDRHSPATLLINPLRSMNLPAFPATVTIFLFIQLTGVHGLHRLSIQLHDAAGTVLVEVPGPKTEGMIDPVAYYQLYWRDLRLKFPRPGHYALVLLAGGEEIGRHALELALTVS